MLSKETGEGYDRTALRIGTTPAYDEYGLIMVFGDIDDGVGYTVWVGRCVGVFMGWGLAGPMVLGFNGSLYKAFTSIDAARRAWVNGPSMDPDWDMPQPRAPIFTHLVLPSHLPPLPSAVTSPASIRSSTSATYVSARAEALAPTPTTTSPENKRNAGSPVMPAVVKPSDRERSHNRPLSGRSLVKPAVVMSSQRQLVTRAHVDSRGDCPLPTPETPSRRKSSPHHPVSTAPSSSIPETPRTSTSSIPSTTTSTIIVSEGRAYVVVRGDTPGVYTDKATAVLMAGRHTGRKLRVFHSVVEAERYYAYKVSVGETGVPAYQHEVA